MGGIVGNLGKGILSSLQQLDKQKSTAAYYRRLAADKEYQAAYAAVTAQRQDGYLLQSAREKIREIYQNYRQAAAEQRAGLAAAGLRRDSVTVQQLLKNSRFQALLDEQTVQNDLQTNMYENNLAAAEQIRALKNSAQEYRRSAHKSRSGWTLGISLMDLFSTH